MSVSRREFIERTASAAVLVGVSSPSLLNAALLEGDSISPESPAGDLTGERVAYTYATWYRPYKSRIAHDPDNSTWVQIDLGSTRPIDEVKLLPWHLGF